MSCFVFLKMMLSWGVCRKNRYIDIMKNNCTTASPCLSHQSERQALCRWSSSGSLTQLTIGPLLLQVICAGHAESNANASLQLRRCANQGRCVVLHDAPCLFIVYFNYSYYVWGAPLQCDHIQMQSLFLPLPFILWLSWSGPPHCEGPPVTVRSSWTT